MEYLLKSTFVLSLFYFFYILFLQKDTFFQSIRFYFITGIVAALVIPIITIKKYVFIDPVFISGVDLTKGQINTMPESAFSWSQILLMAYAVGVIFFSIKLFIQFGSLLWFLYSNPKSKRGKFIFVNSKKNIAPFSFFKYIVLNPDKFNTNELDQIIAHEKIHAKQLHSIDNIIIQIMAIFNWFNPFVWLYIREIQKNLEFIADEHAQGITPENQNYQYLLLKTILPYNQTTLTTNFYNSLIKKRIDMLQKNRSSKTMQIKFLLIIPMLIAFVFTFNTKVIAQKKSDWKVEIVTNSVDYYEFINKDTNNSELKKIKNSFGEQGAKFKYSKLQRNEKGEITGISVSIKNKEGNEGKVSQKSNKPISPIKIHLNLTTGELSVGNISDNDMNRNVLFSSGNDSLYNNVVVKSSKKGDKNVWFTDDNVKVISGNKNNKYVIVTDEDGENKTITVTVDDNKEIQFGDSKNKNISVWVSDDDSTTLSVGGDKNKSDTYIIKRIEGEDDLIVGHNGSFDENNNFVFVSDGIIKGDSTKIREVKIINIEEENDGNHKVIIKEDKSTNENSFTIKIDEDKTDVSNNKNIIYRSKSSKTPLFILDGKEMKDGKFEDIEPNAIQSISVLKGEKSIEKYGDKGKDGVIEITTKK